jgi:bacterioferritin-associated ferredoxin
MSADKENSGNEVMCHCSGTRRNQIRKLFLQGKDKDSISRWTGALSGCGGCEWDIEVYLEALAKDCDSPELSAESIPLSSKPSY